MQLISLATVEARKENPILEKNGKETFRWCNKEILEAMPYLPSGIYLESDSASISYHPEIRGSLWKILLFLPDVVDPVYTPACDQYGIRMFEVAASFFRAFVENQSYGAAKGHIHSEIIGKDITRTFPRHIFFRPNGIGTAMLRTVLLAYAYFDEEVGYCQGMNFIAGFLLLQYEPQSAFCCLSAMFNDPRFLLREMFLPHFPLVQKLNVAFQRLMKNYLPKRITQKFESLGLVSFILDSVTTQWWMTLLVNALSIQYAMKVWDNFFRLGWVGIFSTVLGLIIAQQQTIEKMDTLQDATDFLRHRMCSTLPNREPACVPFVPIRQKDNFLPQPSRGSKFGSE